MAYVHAFLAIDGVFLLGDLVVPYRIYVQFCSCWFHVTKSSRKRVKRQGDGTTSEVKQVSKVRQRTLMDPLDVEAGALEEGLKKADVLTSESGFSVPLRGLSSTSTSLLTATKGDLVRWKSLSDPSSQRKIIGFVQCFVVSNKWSELCARLRLVEP